MGIIEYGRRIFGKRKSEITLEKDETTLVKPRTLREMIKNETVEEKEARIFKNRSEGQKWRREREKKNGYK